jgi:bifunctional DNA-binding transcriptional regulator/antitoxin component of YhaV-PrlF toxin-antitoxin module
MVSVATTHISSKGQIVIPRDMRQGFKKGEQFFVIRDKGTLLLESVHMLDDRFKQENEFARETERALHDVKQGKFKQFTRKELRKELKTW